MAPNHKLTKIIKGRKVVGTSNSDGKTIITFDDGSTLRVKTGDAATSSTRSDSKLADQRESESVDEKSDSAASQSEMPKMTFAPFAPFKSLSGETEKSSETPKTETSKTESQNADDTEAPKKQAKKTSASDETITKVASQSASTGGTVESVRQNDATLHLEFEGGSKMEISLLEASSSVMLRGKDNAMEYAD